MIDASVPALALPLRPTANGLFVLTGFEELGRKHAKKSNPCGSMMLIFDEPFGASFATSLA